MGGLLPISATLCHDKTIRITVPNVGSGKNGTRYLAGTVRLDLSSAALILEFWLRKIQSQDSKYKKKFV